MENIIYPAFQGTHRRNNQTLTNLILTFNVDRCSQILFGIECCVRFIHGITNNYPTDTSLLNKVGYVLVISLLRNKEITFSGVSQTGATQHAQNASAAGDLSLLLRKG